MDHEFEINIYTYINKLCDRVGIVMFKITCAMLPETMAKLYSKNKDYHAHATRDKNLLRIPAGTKNFSFNSARRLECYM